MKKIIRVGGYARVSHEEQKKYESYIEKICRIYWNVLLMGTERIALPKFVQKNNIVNNDSLQTLINILKIKKFMEEEREEEENEIFN